MLKRTLLLSIMLVLSGLLAACQTTQPIEPPTPIVPANVPVTTVTLPPTAVPPTAVPPTVVPPTAVPPTAQPTVTVAPIPGAPVPPATASSSPSSAPGCVYRAAFLGDVSFPDNIITAPGTVMLKTWRVRNDGNCAWGPGQAVQSLVFVNGTSLGAPSQVTLPTYTAPGGIVDVSVNLIAPQQDGAYRSEWMLMAAQGSLFGVGPTYQTPLYAQIQVRRGIPDGGPCVYAAKFLGDASVPDNSPIAPNAPFVKIWRIRNDSTCAWGSGYALHTLVFLGGTPLGSPQSLELPQAVQPGETTEIAVPLVAPNLPGTYRAEWKLRVDGGQLVGVGPAGQTALYVQIVVPNNSPCTFHAKFLGDVTIPDNTRMSAGQVFRKTWRLLNDGTCAWGANTVVSKLTNTNNYSLSAPGLIALPDVEPGSTIDLSIDMVAPGTAGLHRSEWMFMVDEGGLRGLGPQGETPLYVQIYVVP